MLFRFLTFFTFFSVGLCGTTFFLLRRRLGLSRTGNRNLLIIFSLTALFMIVSPMIYRGMKPDVESLSNGLLQWTQYLLMGWLAMLLLVFLTLEFAQLFSRPFDPKKRIFLTEGVAKGVFFGTTLATGIGFLEANAGPEIHDVKIKLPTLPTSFQGLVIAQISDVHIGPLLHRNFLNGVIDQVMSLNPDLIFITGDLVDGSVDQLRDQVEPLKRLQAKEGVYFCTGNHEYYSGVDEWIPHLESMGIHVFKNTNKILTRKNGSNEEKLMIAGVYDWKAAQTVGEVCDPKRAAETSESVNCKLLLSHNPKGVADTVAAGFDLQFSGHTHAGQFAPLTFFMKIFLQHTEGLYQVSERTQLYINRGTGYWGPPNRLGKRSEITKITLS